MTEPLHTSLAEALYAIREEVVTSLQGSVGPEGDLLNPDAESCRQIVLPNPILRNPRRPTRGLRAIANRIQGRTSGIGGLSQCVRP